MKHFRHFTTWQAAKSGNLTDLIRLVEEAEAETKTEGRRQVVVNERDKKDRTPLHYASQAGHLNIVKFLVQNGAGNYTAYHRNTRAWYTIDSSPDIMYYVLLCVVVENSTPTIL